MPRGIPTAGQRRPRAADRRAIRPLTLDPNQLYSVEETAASCGVSVATIWKEIKDGTLQSRKVGARRLVLGGHIIDRNLGIEPAPTEAPEAAGAQ